MTGKDILLVEDNPDDAELTRIAFDEAGCQHRLHLVHDGVEALDYLFLRGRHAAREPAELPAMVLLDLNLPKLDGREVLRAMRANAATRELPVVVLTTSAEPFDVEDVYALGADSHIQKPVEFERFVDAVRRIDACWLAVDRPAGEP
ncbi:MAG: response regulator [Lysobacteraceae bacterium]|nr:MAG: response regulator [Xanthomonadaceae bacterium]